MTMALEEEPSRADQEMRPALDCLRDCAALAAVDARTFTALARAASQFSLPAGMPLFDAGARCEGVYLLVSGRLGVRYGASSQWVAEIAHGELVGEAGWLTRQPHSANVIALRDSELILIPGSDLDTAAAVSTSLCLALARLSAQRLVDSNHRERPPRRARVFVIVPNNEEVDVAELATQLVAEFAHGGPSELVWDVRASMHTLTWFNGIEARNDYVVYVADPFESAWTRQCCRQADVVLLAARARSMVRPWPPSVRAALLERDARVELALLHDGNFQAGAATRWLAELSPSEHHQLVDSADLGRMARLLTRRGVGLVLSGGGARGFAHLGLIRALREARIPIDFIGGVSIGAIIAAGMAMGWSDEEMRRRYRRGFVDSNPVNDYTFPWVALTRGRKVARLLEREYGEIVIEDLRTPFFCLSANLTTGRAFEHRAGSLAQALRASVAIPGILPPVCRDSAVLVDGAAINNLPVDIMQRHAPGLVIGCDVGADRSRDPHRQFNIFQILMRTGMMNSAATAAAQRNLADILLKPPLANIDLLNWRAFDRAVEAGYRYAQEALDEFRSLPRLGSEAVATPSSLNQELATRLTHPATG